MSTGSASCSTRNGDLCRILPEPLQSRRYILRSGGDLPRQFATRPSSKPSSPHRRAAKWRPDRDAGSSERPSRGDTSLAARYRLPAVYPFRFFAEVGGLLSYGSDQIDNFRRAATYADRILKGEKPGELPVQAPVKFELVINLKTAKALGLDVPSHLQQRADEVIE